MKRFLILMGMIFVFGLASAHGYWLEDYDGFDRDDYKEKIVVYTYYDNDDRYSTYDYRHGYSYRATGAYSERKIDLDYRVGYRDGYRDCKKGKRCDWDRDYDRYDYDYRDDYYDRGRKGIGNRYVPHLRVVEGRECYTYPPADRLFYIAC